MKLIDHTGHLVETDHAFVIEQILKHGGKKAPEDSPGRKPRGKGK